MAAIGNQYSSAADWSAIFIFYKAVYTCMNLKCKEERLLTKLHYRKKSIDDKNSSVLVISVLLRTKRKPRLLTELRDSPVHAFRMYNCEKHMF